MPVIRRHDYRPVPYLVPSVELTVRLFADHAVVESVLDLTPNPLVPLDCAPLVLKGVELTLPEEPKLNMLRERFEERPGRLSNASVAQPEAPAQLVIGRDNQLHMPEVVARSI